MKKNALFFLTCIRYEFQNKISENNFYRFEQNKIICIRAKRIKKLSNLQMLFCYHMEQYKIARCLQFEDEL